MRSSRSVTVKYKHTPFHQTVAELYDRFAPPPPPIPPPTATATPKAAKSSRKRDVANGDGEGSTRKKPRKKSSVGAGADGQNPDGTDQPDGTPQLKRKRQYKRKESVAAAGEARPEGAPTQNEIGADGAAHLDSVVNVDAAEAVQRREKARELLTNAGVDPESLSADQFNIFSNQSPALQSESLAMLVEYGAERLRIIHPNKDNSAENTAGSQAAPAPTAEAPAGAEAQAGIGTPTSGAKRQRVTRGSCSNCRGQKGAKVRAFVSSVSVLTVTDFVTVRTREAILSELRRCRHRLHIPSPAEPTEEVQGRYY